MFELLVSNIVKIYHKIFLKAICFLWYSNHHYIPIYFSKPYYEDCIIGSVQGQARYKGYTFRIDYKCKLCGEEYSRDFDIIPLEDIEEISNIDNIGNGLYKIKKDKEFNNVLNSSIKYIDIGEYIIISKINLDK